MAAHPLKVEEVKQMNLHDFLYYLAYETSEDIYKAEISK